MASGFALAFGFALLGLLATTDDLGLLSLFGDGFLGRRRGHLNTRGGDVHHGQVVVCDGDADPLGDLQVAHLDALAELQGREVHVEAVRDVGGEALHLDLAHDHVHDAALVLHAVGHALEDDRHLDVDLLVHLDALEVGVDEGVGDGVDLDVLHHDVALLLGPLHGEEQDRVRPLLRAQDLDDALGVDGDGHGLLAAAVNDAGDHPDLGGLLAGLLADHLAALDFDFDELFSHWELLTFQLSGPSPVTNCYDSKKWLSLQGLRG